MAGDALSASRIIVSPAVRHYRMGLRSLCNIGKHKRQCRTKRRIRYRLLLLERKYHLPVALHVDNRPMIGWREVERHVEAAEMRLPIVGVFAFGIGMMD